MISFTVGVSLWFCTILLMTMVILLAKRIHCLLMQAMVGLWLAGSLFILPVLALTILTGEPLKFSLNILPILDLQAEFELNPVNSFFLLPVCLLAPFLLLSLVGYVERKRFIGVENWLILSFLATILAILVVLLSQNAIVFLMAWEWMTLSAYVLIVLSVKLDKEVTPTWSFLAYGQISGLSLMILFLTMYAENHSYSFGVWHKNTQLRAALSHHLIYLCVLIAFGAKCGLFPMHHWLPITYKLGHGICPALFSGIMSNLGIYGFLFFTTMLGSPPSWYLWALMILGLISGLWGIGNQ